MPIARARRLIALLVIVILVAPANAETAINSIRVSSRMDLNSILLSGIDVVFFYDTSIVSDQPFTQFDWYSKKREYRETHADVIRVLNLPILQGFDSATLSLPEGHREALKVLVFAEHQTPQSAPADVTGMTNVLIEIDQFGVLVSDR
ncbi:MAG: hypothetical protein Q8L60_01895 [Gammaproteobacteria bacterium]|nr:hypothetical protein [Gammaproteobacteria bacterium]MDP2142403.1 hypothetical protein [Gammaproteobacteria bacterium]MDP2348644.1 hypothetical protein [Gammaproteobacteria bacterium]